MRQWGSALEWAHHELEEWPIALTQLVTRGLRGAVGGVTYFIFFGLIRFVLFFFFIVLFFSRILL